MSLPRLSVAALAASALTAFAAPAYAGGQYVGGSLGWVDLSDSDNSGAFNDDTLNGPAAAPAEGEEPVLTPIDAGTPVGWTTEFDGGFFVSGAYGWRFDNGFRVEGEISYTDNDVDTHTGVTLAGDPIGALDAAALLPGATETLGLTVADVVADGQGSVESLGFAVNGFYDFRLNPNSPFGASVGAGVGVADVDVEYAPSDVGIISESDTSIFFQVMAQLSFAFSENAELYGGYRYRAGEDIETSSVESFSPIDLDVEYNANIFEGGVRFYF